MVWEVHIASAGISDHLWSEEKQEQKNIFELFEAGLVEVVVEVHVLANIGRQVPAAHLVQVDGLPKRVVHLKPVVRLRPAVRLKPVLRLKPAFQLRLLVLVGLLAVPLMVLGEFQIHPIGCMNQAFPILPEPLPCVLHKSAGLGHIHQLLPQGRQHVPLLVFLPMLVFLALPEASVLQQAVPVLHPVPAAVVLPR